MKGLQRNRYGAPLKLDTISEQTAAKFSTHTDVPTAWLQTLSSKSTYTDIAPQAHSTSPQPFRTIHRIYPHNGLEKADEGSLLEQPTAPRHEIADESSIDTEILTRSRTLDVNQLSSDELEIASRIYDRITVLGVVGVGSSGEVTRCILEDGKTLFALKV